jgi:hypothetical protein
VSPLVTEEETVDIVIAVDPPEKAIEVERIVSSMGGDVYLTQSEGVGRVWTIIGTHTLDNIRRIEGVSSVTELQPMVHCMDNITSNSFMGMDAAQVGGFTGEGILGGVRDSGLDGSHPDYDIDYYDGWGGGGGSHGTSCFGPLFSKGTNNMKAQGSLPDATSVFMGTAYTKYDSMEHLWTGNFQY